MKRGYLFATALAAAIITFTSLSAIFGRTHFLRYGYYDRHHHCGYYDNRYHENDAHRRHADSTH